MGSVAVFHARSGPADAEVGRRMTAAAPHRGAAYDVATLGRTTLAVSYDERFPDASLARDGELCVAFTGTLDNRDELDAELAGGPPIHNGSGDADTVLGMIRRWGTDGIARLRGSFAGAVTDGRTARAFRDHIGSKPLFYRDDPRGFYAATEIKQVLAGAGVRRDPDPAGLEDIFYGEVASRTAVAGVERVDRGSVATVDGSTLQIRRFWDPRSFLERERVGGGEARDRLATLLEQAATRCVTGNDAILLSGGIDSPTVAAWASGPHLATSGKPLAALSAVYPDHASVDERPLIESVARHLGLPLETYVPHAGVLDDVERWVDLCDGPTDTLSLPQAAEAYGHVAALGRRTILTGEMAEYVFEIRHYLIDHLIANRRWRAAGRLVAMQRRRGSAWVGIGRDLVRALLPPRVSTAYMRRKRIDHRRLPPWIDAKRMGGLGARPDLARPAARRWTELQVAPFLGAAITFEADEICAAACGVNVRWPFADIDLWQFALGLQAETKFPDLIPKSLIRDAMKHRLPDAILARREKTFFNEYSMAKAEYPTLRRLLLRPSAHIQGVDYRILADRLERADMDLVELQWARDLARLHAFIEVCS
jgi:asparagine synthase (glutamine-hydrolysing)